MSSSAITIVISLGAIHWFIVESVWTKSKLKNGYRIYSAPKGLKALYFISLPMFVYGAIVNWIENPSEKWVSGILLAIVVMGGYFFPSTILLSRDRVVSIRWFGLKRVEMNSNDIDAIYSSPEDRSIIVQDKRQKQIVHTIFNVDRESFIAELRALPPALSGTLQPGKAEAGKRSQKSIQG
jgi:hypothetical protein